MHAYVGLPLGPVALASMGLNGDLRVTVTDEGGGMIPRTDSPRNGPWLIMFPSSADLDQVDLLADAVEDGLTPRST